MLTVKILGSGCANCRKLEAVAREAATGAGLQADFVKVTDMKTIMAYDLLASGDRPDMNLVLVAGDALFVP